MVNWQVPLYLVMENNDYNFIVIYWLHEVNNGFHVSQGGHLFFPTITKLAFGKQSPIDMRHAVSCQNILNEV